MSESRFFRTITNDLERLPVQLQAKVVNFSGASLEHGHTGLAPVPPLCKQRCRPR